jgi:hypothetical protein
MLRFQLQQSNCFQSVAGIASFGLTSISGGQHCASMASELAVKWQSLDIHMFEDCGHYFTGREGHQLFPTTFAQVSYPTRTGTRRPYAVLQGTPQYFQPSISNSWR